MDVLSRRMARDIILICRRKSVGSWPRGEDRSCNDRHGGSHRYYMSGADALRYSQSCFRKPHRLPFASRVLEQSACRSLPLLSASLSNPCINHSLLGLGDQLQTILSGVGSILNEDGDRCHSAGSRQLVCPLVSTARHPSQPIGTPLPARDWIFYCRLDQQHW